MFIKKTAVFYFVDLKTVRLYALIDPKLFYEFGVISNLTISHKSYYKTVVNIRWTVDHGYTLHFIDFKLNFSTELNTNLSKNELKLEIRENIYYKKRKNSPFKAKIRFFHAQKETSTAAICSKCVYLNDYLALK
jgi:hypothetical protein